jgi:hypothetical protein
MATTQGRVALLVQLVTAGRTVVAQVGDLTLTGVAGSFASGGSSVAAQTATLTLTGATSGFTAGNATKPAQVGALTITGIAGDKAFGPTTRPAQIAELFLTGIPGSGTIIGGGGSPTLLTVGTRSGTTVALSWTGPTGGGLVSLYNIEQSPDNSVWTFNSTSIGSATNGVAIGLTDFTTYYFRVQAVFTASGPGPWSAAVLATTTAIVYPSAVSGLTVGTVTDTSVQLSWTAATSTPIPVLDYWGSYNDGGSDSGFFLSGDLVLTDTVTGLRPGALYTFYVLARNADAFGPSATVSQATTGTLTGTAQVGFLTLTAQAGTVTGGAVTKTAQVGALALTAQPGVNTISAAPQTTTGQVGALTLTAVVGTKVGGGVTVTAQMAAVPLSGVQGALTGGPVTKTTQVALLTLTGIAGTRSVGPPPNQTATAQIVALTLTARPGSLSLIGGATQTFTAQIGPLFLDEIQGTLIGGPASKTAQIAALTFTGVPGEPTRMFNATAQVATLTLTGRAGTLSFGGASQDAQSALLTFTALPGRLGIPFALSAHSDGTGLKDQRVEIRVNNCDGQWGLFVRGPAALDLAVEWPGYYVANTLDGVSWFRAGVRVETQTLPAFTTAGGTIELECIDDLCTLRVHGMAVSTHDFSADPIVDDDDHQGFASYGGAGFAITDAEGGGIVTVAPEPEADEDREPLFPTSPPEQRRPLATTSSSVRRPL